MKKLLLIVLLALAAHVQAQKAATDYKARLDSLLQDPMFETSHVGIMVYDLTAGRTLYTHGHRQLLRPASTMKLLTAVTALRELGGSYCLKTRFRYQGAVCDSVFTGSIYCIGGFDPAFSADEMNVVIDSIRSRGINAIRGTIVTDRSMKDLLPFGEGWSWDDPNPTLSPLLYNRRDQLAEQMVSQLNDVGIATAVTIVDDVCPDSIQSLCTVSHTLDQILLQMMKKSDNLYAEAVFYQLAAATGTPFATAAQAHEAERRLIAELGLNPADYRLADGSGLSLYNYLSAELLVRLLRYAWQNQQIYDHLYPTLPSAGFDGTLKDRMKGPLTRGNVWAKTGTLTGVSSLAGYLLAPNQHILAFAIINQGLRNGRDGRNFQDRFCEALCRP